jgi:hypothetical protein
MKLKRFNVFINEKLSGSEAVYGFAGWLTSRKDKTIMSSSDDASVIADLVDEFNKKQELEEPREHWEEDLIPMDESMGYTDFFGKKISHEDALHKSIRDYIVNIMMDDLHISEKSFKEIDNLIEKVKNICNKNPEIYEQAEEYYQSGKRLNLLAEKIYDEYFKNLNEKI